MTINTVMRSLWVQGYTVVPAIRRCVISAFPVGTGIYRLPSIDFPCFNCVPCGYRDIPQSREQ